MIIKRTKKSQNKNIQQAGEQPSEKSAVASETPKISAAETGEAFEQIQPTTEPVAEQTAADILADINFDDINLESRSERRLGSRRRGYRRSEDRGVVSRAQEEAESIRLQAIEEGKKEGLQAASEDIDKLNNALLDFFEYKNEVFKAVSAGIYDISVEIARKIINRELQQDKTALMSLIKNALQDTYKHQNRITVKVKPEDAPIVKEMLPEYLIDGGNEININVIPDENIVTGGAIIMTENGIIDATVDTGLSILEQAFKQMQE